MVLLIEQPGSQDRECRELQSRDRRGADVGSSGERLGAWVWG